MFWTRLNPFNGSVWNRFQELQSEMNRLFDRGDGREQAWNWAGFPAVNLWEENDNLYVEAELPGMDLKDVEIYVTGHNQLTIKGERKPLTFEKGATHRQERAFGSFVRTLTLPFPVDANQVEARLENGVLRISLPKHEAARPRKIAVKA